MNLAEGRGDAIWDGMRVSIQNNGGRISGDFVIETIGQSRRGTNCPGPGRGVGRLLSHRLGHQKLVGSRRSVYLHPCVQGPEASVSEIQETALSGPTKNEIFPPTRLTRKLRVGGGRKLLKRGSSGVHKTASFDPREGSKHVSLFRGFDGQTAVLQIEKTACGPHAKSADMVVLPIP